MITRYSSEVVNGLNLKDEYLRLIAFVAMVIDHIAFLYEPENFIARGVGRIALPIFLYLLIKGFRRTRSIGNYFFRLALWGTATQIAIYALSIPIPHNNILLMMAYCIIMLDICERWGWQWLGFFCIGAEALNFEYGCYGIFVCYLMQFKFDKKFWFFWITLHLLMIIYGFPEIQILALIVPCVIDSARYFMNEKLDKLIIKIPRSFWYPAYLIQWVFIKSFDVFWAI